jgi:hypothetical protein
MADKLEQVTDLPDGTFDVFRRFYAIRNQIVHGKTNVSDSEVLRAIDSGITLFRSLTAIQLPLQRVYRADVPTFSDRSLKQRLDCLGVILELNGNTANETALHMYPTTKRWFVEGMDVTWEWNHERTWSEGWFEDLETGVPTIGWSNSMEFVGRNLDEV